MTDEPRPKGFDYTKPDPEDCRCQQCNQDGMNRTGLRPVAYIGATTTGAHAIRCPNRCFDGLVRKAE